jgi:hypothetical protein
MSNRKIDSAKTKLQLLFQSRYGSIREWVVLTFLVKYPIKGVLVHDAQLAESARKPMQQGDLIDPKQPRSG